jgi:hypothetical protein
MTINPLASQDRRHPVTIMHALSCRLSINIMSSQGTVLHRSNLAWEGVLFAVDQDKITSKEVEECAGEVVAIIKLHPSLYGGEYTIFLAKVLRGFKVELACWFSLSHAGAQLDWGMIPLPVNGTGCLCSPAGT